MMRVVCSYENWDSKWVPPQTVIDPPLVVCPDDSRLAAKIRQVHRPAIFADDGVAGADRRHRFSKIDIAIIVAVWGSMGVLGVSDAGDGHSMVATTLC